MALAFADISFTPSVRDQQDRNGSGMYAKFLSPDRNGGDILTDHERQFIEARDGFYQATVSETGWPYVQFRGGPAGFLQVLDAKTIIYADLRGNRQYISLGNLTVNTKVSLILMDYARAQRLKVWGHVDVITPESSEWQALQTDAIPHKAERLIRITVDAFDWNCPQHIPHRLTAEEAGGELLALRDENQHLKAQLSLAQGQNFNPS